jgi:hypothetical protein
MLLEEKRFGEEPFGDMAYDSLVFIHTLRDVQMVLAKRCEWCSIAFSTGVPLYKVFFGLIRPKFDRNGHWLFPLNGSEAMPRQTSRLSRLIRRRNPYVGPIAWYRQASLALKMGIDRYAWLAATHFLHASPLA